MNIRCLLKMGSRFKFNYFPFYYLKRTNKKQAYAAFIVDLNKKMCLNCNAYIVNKLFDINYTSTTQVMSMKFYLKDKMH